MDLLLRRHEICLVRDTVPGREIGEYRAGQNRNLFSAADWSRKLCIPMHEIVIDTNLYRLSIIFYDLEVTSPSGWQPYTRLMSS
jgi:hypothetical protein